MQEQIQVSILQIAPVFLNKERTIQKLVQYIKKAKSSDIVVWGESLIPGYPQWLAMTGGAKFNDPDQKKAYSTYWKNSVDFESNDLVPLFEVAKETGTMLIGGLTERSGGSLYCTYVVIGQDGRLLGRHRKIKPTYEERLVWADGDASGLTVYSTPMGKIGALNCWENWIPLARASLHSQGEFIHVSLWPGSLSLTENISIFSALEGRMYVLAASGFLRGQDFSHLSEEEFPMKAQMAGQDIIKNGGSLVVNPRGEIIAGPLLNEEGILTAVLDLNTILEERQNFDYSGHYSRWDIFNRPLKQD